MSEIDKNTVYIKALERLELTENGLCSCIWGAFKHLYPDHRITIEGHPPCVFNFFESDFPELMEYKPSDKDINQFWWNPNDIDIRKKVLKELIEKTK